MKFFMRRKGNKIIDNREWIIDNSPEKRLHTII